MARMTRFAICTGWSRARKRRAVHPSITRLARASSRSSIPSLQDLRPDQDDHRRHVDPGQQSGSEGERTVRLEDAERAREEAERDLGDLPEHGRYQRRAAGRAPRDGAPRRQPEHQIKEPEPDREPDGRRQELEQPPQAADPTGGHGLRRGLDAEAADDQGQQGDEGEEDLVGDRAGEERAVVCEERADHTACRYEDAALPFGVGAAGASAVGRSVFAGVPSFDGAPLLRSAVLPSAVLPSAVLPSPAVPSAAFVSPPSFCAGRLSVLYQPAPLNTIAGVAISL